MWKLSTSKIGLPRRTSRVAPADAAHPAFGTGRIPSLDGLRAVSILLVIAFHVSKTRNSPIPEAAYWYVAQGAVGVDLFFAISGFLITMLLLREREKTGTVSLRGFYARRALRILPAFLAYLGVMAIFAQLKWIHLESRDWLAALTYTVNFFDKMSPPFVHLWSLSLEEHFYLVWPPLFLILGARRAAKVALVCLLAEPMVRWCLFHYAHGYIDIDYATPARLDSIAAGCLMAIAACSKKPSRILARLDANPAAWFFGALVMLSVSSLLLSQSGKYMIAARHFVNALAICVMIWTAARFPGASFGRVLNWAPLAWLGRISYSLYIWQQVFLTPSNGEMWMCRFPQNLGLSLAAAVASFYLIERPFLALRKRPRRAHDVGERAPAPGAVIHPLAAPQ